ncbi:MAG: hypothetical protein Q9226_006413 [Calogaya cf. arnoldii]
MVRGNKRGRGRSSGNRQAGNRGHGLKQHFVAPNNDGSNRHGDTAGPASFSLRDEVRNTDRTYLWNSASKLRHSQVNFISAGNSVPDELLKPTASPSAEPRATSHSPLPQASLASMTIEDQILETAGEHIDGQNFGEGTSTKPESQDAHPPDRNEGQPKHELFFMDGTGSQVKAKSKLKSPKLARSLSPTPSNSSDEVIVFTGRKAVQRSTPEQNPTQSKSHAQGVDPPRLGNDERGRADGDSTGPFFFAAASTADGLEPQAQRRETRRRSSGSPIIPSQGDDDFTIPIAQSCRRRSKRQAPAKQSRSQAVEEEILADYIANMVDEDVLDEVPDGRDLDEPPTTHPQVMATSPSAIDTDAAEEAINSLLNQSSAWDSNDIRDFDDLSTSTEGYSVLDKVLAARQRPAGQQYLVVGQDQSIDDARWIPLSSLNSANARECIRMFELTRADFQIGAFSSEDSDDSIDDAQLSADLREDLESMEDEHDLLERRQARMTDETIARLLRKQEELGLGSHELLLFDGAEESDEDEEDLSPAAYIPLKKARAKKGRQSHNDFASASLFAAELESDPYGDFDVMDHDRLSLRKKPKGRRGAPTFDLSDVELEAYLQSAWEKDRTKKKIRKKEREELRVQGLLGKNGQPDINTKYKEGITLYQVREEIINFMTSGRQSLALPSMAHKDRKTVHEMANVIKLKSMSNGEGKSRYPVLYKTARTSQFDETTMSSMMKILNSKRFLPRMNPKGTEKAAAIKRARGNAGKTAGVSYQDGEVVGAAAPEIGLENRGRAMLEKMGWSKGTALGALNNKGMLQPVTHIVKTTKAGLG